MLKSPNLCATGLTRNAKQVAFKQARSSRCTGKLAAFHQNVNASVDVANAWKRKVQGIAASVAASVLLLASPTPSFAEAPDANLSPDVTVLDNAKLIATEKRDKLNTKLKDFEAETGWRVRVYTTYGNDGRPSDNALRGAWRPDKRSVVINFDASNPNLTNFVYLGDEVLMKLKRPWFLELQSRYGNIFYIRDEGEQPAILNTMDALTTCLGRPEGCQVVPGLPEDQYTFTLLLSMAGGLVAGAVTRLEPTGWVTARWQWLLIFSPVWASLYINFGLGPVVSRTDDLTPVAMNTAGFLAAAAAPYLFGLLRQQQQQGSGNSSDGDASQ